MSSIFHPYTMARFQPRLWRYILRGWKTRLRGRRYQQSRSQYGEDAVIASLFDAQSAPYVVDVGAHDGHSWSNSYAFIESGFSALLVEPIHRNAESCRYHHKWNRRVIVEETAILPHEGRTKFYVTDDPSGDPYAMTSSVRADMAGHAVEIEVACCPLRTLLERHHVPPRYALLNVDAEGVDLEVLQTAALEHWRPSVICVELGARAEELNSYLTSHGYTLHRQMGANGIYVRGA